MGKGMYNGGQLQPACALLFTVVCWLGKGSCLAWQRVLFQLYLMHFVLIKSVVHRNGRGTHLGTCLVYAACVVAFVACVNGDRFYFMYLILLYRWCTGMDEASALVCA